MVQKSKEEDLAADEPECRALWSAVIREAVETRGNDPGSADFLTNRTGQLAWMATFLDLSVDKILDRLAMTDQTETLCGMEG